MDQTLHFPLRYWVVVCLFLVAGTFADWSLLGPQDGVETKSPDEFQFFLMLCPLFGIGGALMGLQFIHIKCDTFESSYLFSFRQVSRKTCYIQKYSSSGFWLADASGQRIHVHKLMVGASTLHELASNKVVVTGTGPDLETGMRMSQEMRIVSRLKLGKAAFLLLAVFVSGLMAIYRTAGSLLDMVNGHRAVDVGDLCLFSLGTALVVFCAGIIVFYFRQRLRPV